MRLKTFLGFVGPSLFAMLALIAAPLVGVAYLAFHNSYVETRIVEVTTEAPLFGGRTMKQVKQVPQPVLDEDGVPVRVSEYVGAANLRAATDVDRLSAILAKDRGGAGLPSAAGQVYREMMNIDFWRALEFTLLYTFVTLPLVLVIGFLVALAVDGVVRLAGVSQSVVSRVFTPDASVSPAMRARVLRAAEELGYQPNALARSLITQRSRIIGVALAYLNNQYYPMALEKLSLRLQAEGYHTMVFFAANEEPADRLVGTFLEYRVDAVVLASVALSTNWAAACERAGVPVVLFNRSYEDWHFSAVTSTNRAGGRAVAEFLVAGGHRRIAYVAGWEGASTQRDREAGFRDGLAAAGVPLAARAVGDFDGTRARDAALALFDVPADRRPDAVFDCSDHMALVVMDVLRFELGLAVPGQVSVVGYDDVPQAAARANDLTAVRQPVDCMVEATVRVLLDQIERPGAGPERVEIPAPLMVRGSACQPEGWRA